MNKYRRLLLLVVVLILTGCQTRDDYFTDNGCFQVECINTNENNQYSEMKNMNYYYLSENAAVYQYRLDTQEKELLDITDNDVITHTFAIPYFFYTYKSSDDKYMVNRLNIETKEEDCIYEAHSSWYPNLIIIDDNIYIQTDDDERITYRLPIDGDPIIQLEQVNTDRCFSGNISTDNEQYMHLAGRDIVVKKDEQTNANAFFDYQVDGEPSKSIDCFNKKGYANSRLVKGYLTAENENEIKGIMSVSGNRRESVMMFQRDIVRDMLFGLDLDTGESQILYDTKNNQTRIVGYEDGIVYLFKNDYKVYSQPLEGGKATEILSIPRSNDVIFDWCEDYLFVRYRDTNNRVDNQYPQYDIRGAKVK